jgi:hypothetical protein
VSGTRSTLPWTNVFYFNMPTDGTYTSADLKSVIDAAAASYNTNITPILCTTVSVTDWKAVWITGVGTALEYDKATAYAGTTSTDLNDQASCVVVNWAINQYYRGGHPRTYHPSVTTAAVTNGSVVSGTFQTNVATGYTAWMTAVNALTATHVTSVKLGTVSYARGNAWRVPPVFYAYNSVGTRNLLGTQRRRIGGR